MFMIHQICMSLSISISYVSFTEFLWGFTFTFIGPFSYLCGMGMGMGKYARLFSAFVNSSWSVRPDPDETNGLCTKNYVLLCSLNRLGPFTRYYYYYYARTSTKEGSGELGNIAGFFFSNFPYVDVDNNCNYQVQVADLFAVDIDLDLDTKRFVEAKLDDLSLDAKETLPCYG